MTNFTQMFKDIDSLQTKVDSLKANKTGKKTNSPKEYNEEKLALQQEVNALLDTIKTQTSLDIAKKYKKLLSTTNASEVHLKTTFAQTSLTDVLKDARTQVATLEKTNKKVLSVEPSVAQSVPDPVAEPEPTPVDEPEPTPVDEPEPTPVAELEPTPVDQPEPDQVAELEKRVEEKNENAAADAPAEPVDPMTSFKALVAKLDDEIKKLGSAKAKELKVDTLSSGLKALALKYTESSMTKEDFKRGYEAIMTQAVQASLSKQPVLKQILRAIADFILSLTVVLPIAARIVTRNDEKSWRPTSLFFKPAPMPAEAVAKDLTADVTAKMG